MIVFGFQHRHYQRSPSSSQVTCPEIVSQMLVKLRCEDELAVSSSTFAVKMRFRQGYQAVQALDFELDASSVKLDSHSDLGVHWLTFKPD
jgi:hypothetical protein